MRILSLAVLLGLAAAILIADAGKIVAAQDFCTLDWKPVCAIANGAQRTYSNACWSKMSRAQIVHPGPCK